MAAHGDAVTESRPEYASKLELMLTLVGYAVGLGNIWRFPYLAYEHGGGAFLIPYLLSLMLLGLPLFQLELGLGQMFRQGTLGMWSRLGLPRLRGVGVAATLCTFFVSLYYNVILAWTVYYIGRTVGAMFRGGELPWADLGGDCPLTTLVVPAELAGLPTLFNNATGRFNASHLDDFWCPSAGSLSTVDPDAVAHHVDPIARSEANGTAIPVGFVQVEVRPSECPGHSALDFWQNQVLQQSSGMDDLGGFQWGMLGAFTVAWILVYLCVYNGVQSSGKVVYVTATLPYVALVVFFFRAITLPNAATGVTFFVKPDFSVLLDATVWVRAVTQIFYSLGVGFGSLIAFASYGSKHNRFLSDATKVSLINCGTSIFAGFVVFPVLGYLAHELSQYNPCIRSDDLSGLASVGLSGTGLAFVAFPIAIASMPGGFFWAMLFFVMLLCLGIDSQFAMVESIVTVLSDAGVGGGLSRPKLSAVVCVLSYLLGLIFVTRSGIYWFELMDSYSCVVAMFFVTGMECFGVCWFRSSVWLGFRRRVKEWTGQTVGWTHTVSWKFICPALLVVVVAMSLNKWDIMDAASSTPFPAGKGFLPAWSVWVGWTLGLLPLLAALVVALLPTGDVEAEFGAEGRLSASPGEAEAGAVEEGKGKGGSAVTLWGAAELPATREPSSGANITPT